MKHTPVSQSWHPVQEKISVKMFSKSGASKICHKHHNKLVCFHTSLSKGAVLLRASAFTSGADTSCKNKLGFENINIESLNVHSFFIAQRLIFL